MDSKRECGAGQAVEGGSSGDHPNAVHPRFCHTDSKEISDNAHIDRFKAGTDQEEFPPIVSFWSTQKEPIAAGNYDLRLTYDKDKVKAKANLKGFAVGGDHGILKKSVALAKF